MYQIHVTKPAEIDLYNTVFYIANTLKNKTAASNLLAETKKRIQSLSKMPYRYPIVNDPVLATQKIRILQIKNFFVFYIIREETKSITVLRFLYAKSDWLTLLKIQLK